MAKNHVKKIIIVGVTQPEKKLTSSTLLEFPEEDKLDGVVLLGLKKKTPLLAQMVFLSQFPLKTGSVQVRNPQEKSKSASTVELGAIYRGGAHMQIRTCKLLWWLTHQNKTKIDSDEDVHLSIYHRAASKKGLRS